MSALTCYSQKSQRVSIHSIQPYKSLSHSSSKTIHHNRQDTQNNFHADKHNDDRFEVFTVTTVDAFFQQGEHILQHLIIRRGSVREWWIFLARTYLYSGIQ